MIETNDLVLNPDDREAYRTFLQQYEKNVKLLIEDFNNWFTYNRNKLKSIHLNRTDDFIKWARYQFYIWAFNQYKKEIQKEIDNMVK